MSHKIHIQEVNSQVVYVNIDNEVRRYIAISDLMGAFARNVKHVHTDETEFNQMIFDHVAQGVQLTAYDICIYLTRSGVTIDENLKKFIATMITTLRGKADPHRMTKVDTGVNHRR